MKNKLIVALLASWPLAACAGHGKSLSHQVRLPADQKVRIVADRGEFEVVSGGDAALSYKVDFVSNGNSSWWGASEPTPEQLEKSQASFDETTGVLSIRTDEAITAKVRVTLPAKAPLKIEMGAGTLLIASRTGYVDARVDAGTLTYDASGLGKGVCVDARVKVGVITNERDSNCASTGASLAAKTGTITVN